MALNALLPIFGTPATAGRCSPDIQEQLRQLRTNDPALFAAVTMSHETSAQRLARFYGDDLPGPTFQGGEGTVYTTPIDANRTLKVWHPKKLDHFEDAVDYMISTRRWVYEKAEIAKRLRIVQVYERGNDWIIREFVHASIPLPDAIKSDPTAKAAAIELQRVIKKTTKQSDPVARRLIRMIDKNSINLHWDPVHQQIVMIDGF